MAKKRVEVNQGAGTEEMENLSLDLTPQPIIPQAVQRVQQNVEPQAVQSTRNQSEDEEPELINCLRNERIRIEFVPKETAMVKDPRHVLSGGMADTSTRSFVVPVLSSTGQFKNVLTKSEMAFLEHVMGLEKEALSIYRTPCFWDDSNPKGIGRVTLRKRDNYLDLNDPVQYIKYKVLLANKDRICPSLHELETSPKATYEYVIVSETAESQMNLNKADITMKCYMEYGKVENDFDTLRTIIELIEGRPVAAKVGLDFLKSRVIELIGNNNKLFLSVITDELLPAKVLIKKSVEAGLIGKRNDAYYLTDGNQPLCEIGEESTLTNAARYISSVRRQELKYTLEAKLKVE